MTFSSCVLLHFRNIIMITYIIEYLIRKKNPNFQFDKDVPVKILFILAVTKVVQQLRAFKLLFSGHLPKKIFLGKNVRFFHASNIQFGDWVQLEDQVYVSALGRQPVVFGDNVKIGAFSQIVCATSFDNIGEYIRIGNNVGIGEFAYLGGGGGLEIGDDCIIGQYLSCHPENHHFLQTDKLIRLQGVSRKGIRIGKNCWIGAKVTILDGVTIGDNCVIAAGAVVTKDMPSNSVLGGVPAKVIKNISSPKQSSTTVFQNREKRLEVASTH